MNLTEELFKLQDLEYKEFQSNLTPTLTKDKFIGVRVPKIRALAKKYLNTEVSKTFINSLPHKYYDEYILHGLLISEIKDYDECLKEVNRLLPYVDNWAVCDTLSPKTFKKHKKELINEIKTWCKSKNTYECRFGIEMLMRHYLDEDFNKKYLLIPSKIKSKEYYVNMMIAWFYATALVKQWDKTIPYIENKVLDKWTHNKTISKSCESYRITKEQKEYLKTLRIK